MFDNFFSKSVAKLIHDNYPTIENGEWDDTTYIDQRNKYKKSSFDTGSTYHTLFNELNSKEFINWIQELSEIEEELVGDDGLFGGGLHQSISGAFLNVHVDYNIHPETKFHRRLNVLIYMNKDWKDSFEGHLELWNMEDGEKELLGKYSPDFNRCVIFETNEVSYHGHPKPLKTPDGIRRKSIATYYYTNERPHEEIRAEHNTIYVNTNGVLGQMKRLSSGFKALAERVFK